MAATLGWALLVGMRLSTLALIAAAAPLLGARRRLSELKAAELSRAREAIDAARREALASPASEAGTRASARLPGLLAWEARVMDVPVWLFDASALRKLGLYLLIPLASWICAALVERALETALS